MRNSLLIGLINCDFIFTSNHNLCINQLNTYFDFALNNWSSSIFTCLWRSSDLNIRKRLMNIAFSFELHYLVSNAVKTTWYVSYKPVVNQIHKLLITESVFLNTKKPRMKNTLSIILECLLQEVFQNTLIYILTYWYILACFRKTSCRPDLSFIFFLSYFMGIWSYII